MWPCPPVCSNTHNLLPGRFVGNCCRYPGLPTFHPPFLPTVTYGGESPTDGSSFGCGGSYLEYAPSTSYQGAVCRTTKIVDEDPPLNGRATRAPFAHCLGGEGCQGSPNAIAACPSLSLLYLSPDFAAGGRGATRRRRKQPKSSVVPRSVLPSSRHVSIYLSTSLWCSNVQIVVSKFW